MPKKSNAIKKAPAEKSASNDIHGNFGDKNNTSNVPAAAGSSQVQSKDNTRGVVGGHRYKLRERLSKRFGEDKPKKKPKRRRISNDSFDDKGESITHWESYDDDVMIANVSVPLITILDSDDERDDPHVANINNSQGTQRHNNIKREVLDDTIMKDDEYNDVLDDVTVATELTNQSVIDDTFGEDTLVAEFQRESDGMPGGSREASINMPPPSFAPKSRAKRTSASKTRTSTHASPSGRRSRLSSQQILKNCGYAEKEVAQLDLISSNKSRHHRDCGGRFMKISEPEKPKKSNAVKKAPAEKTASNDIHGNFGDKNNTSNVPAAAGSSQVQSKDNNTRGVVGGHRYKLRERLSKRFGEDKPEKPKKSNAIKKAPAEKSASNDIHGNFGDGNNTSNVPAAAGSSQVQSKDNTRGVVGGHRYKLRERLSKRFGEDKPENQAKRRRISNDSFDDKGESITHWESYDDDVMIANVSVPLITILDSDDEGDDPHVANINNSQGTQRHNNIKREVLDDTIKKDDEYNDVLDDVTAATELTNQSVIDDTFGEDTLVAEFQSREPHNGTANDLTPRQLRQKYLHQFPG